MFNLRAQYARTNSAEAKRRRMQELPTVTRDANYNYGASGPAVP
jgi:hypothetical protein